MTGRLILLRHGETTANVDGALDTVLPGHPLTDKGQAQAMAAGLDIATLVGAGHGTQGRLVAVVCSGALRARQTADLVISTMEGVAGLEPNTITIAARDELKEISAGEVEMKSDPASIEEYVEAFLRMLDGNDSKPLRGGETSTDFLARYRPVLEELVQDYLTGPDGDQHDVLVVAHGAAIRMIGVHAAGATKEDVLGTYLDNCKYAIVEPGDKPFGQWTLRNWAGHDYHPSR